ncbi:hypothetical protein ACLOJK_000834 [Asimina triloba]
MGMAARGDLKVQAQIFADQVKEYQNREQINAERVTSQRRSADETGRKNRSRPFHSADITASGEIKCLESAISLFVPLDFSSTPMSAAPSGIQGQLLEVTVVGCNKLRDTEWISRQDPYVCVEYANTKFRTRTCTDGHKNPTFQEKFVFSLIEGLRELNVVVWNSNTLTFDDFIGSGKVQLQKVLAQGYDDTPWTLQSKSGRYAGEVRLILHYANAKKPASAPPYTVPVVSPYSAPPSSTASLYPSVGSYPASSPYPSYPPSAAYPPSAYPSQPTNAYPPQRYPSQPTTGAYPSQPTNASYPSQYPSQPTTAAYPPQPYPPTSYPPQPYPPPQQVNPYYPPGSYVLSSCRMLHGLIREFTLHHIEICPYQFCRRMPVVKLQNPQCGKDIRVK